MQVHEKTIDLLNRVLANELVAINQYFLHARMFKNWGYTKIGAKVQAESIDEMKHADLLIERILFLGGAPNMQSMEKLHIGKTLPEMYQSDLALEVKAVADLREAIAHMEKVQDFITRDLLVGILLSEEEHMSWITLQLSLYNAMGSQNYIQSVVE